MKRYRVTEKCPERYGKLAGDIIFNSPVRTYSTNVSLAAGWIEEIRDPLDELFDEIEDLKTTPFTETQANTIRKHWEAQEQQHEEQIAEAIRSQVEVDKKELFSIDEIDHILMNGQVMHTEQNVLKIIDDLKNSKK